MMDHATDHVLDHVPGDGSAVLTRSVGLLVSPRVTVFETATKYGAWTPRGGPIRIATAGYGVAASDLAGAGIAEH